jgi:hypothetical protein
MTTAGLRSQRQPSRDAGLPRAKPSVLNAPLVSSEPARWISPAERGVFFSRVADSVAVVCAEDR